ncbi:probable capsid assembly and DNA maturation protein [Alcelaphine gammaherpesvirus 1]|uniref:Triplex capsid protein 1 n=1 Tax=Alcelaphine herpesvirus 1 (strain C500) TaxID=654901 RepID=TRX1_ALHV1|nr:probable capsid assembly and DNA maturation protein [Alcelaphine gammaherpesvirus 1]O36412.1 RecName: Full=Triplex capsid protein 1 [Alcelaphine herpesvirus 1 strain C500]AAC58109.1 probable capsid assembly and DNA maturation protein [Alcelaphine gammaherpesvirus 1]APB09485.1 capsid triplex subunit 1 [Alcelaphine gammaherpesvirus 1]APB09557.1 capsid triplex subunit 1 [Alcelaphine gammaherpesvirus 1]QDY92295.1 capsid triplex subunit 1 [Alcelaphine gammaherpesvirus 1]
MKTKQDPRDQKNYDSLQSNLFRLIPPTTHKISLARPNGFLRGLADLVGKYSVDGAEESLFQPGAWDAPYVQPAFFDFLVHAKTISKHEPVGVPLFCFKNNSTAPSIDVLFTPISFHAAVGLPADVDPNVHRVAHIWYGDDSEVSSLMEDLNILLEESNLHTRLHPVGILVENNDSSFLNRVTALTHGPAYMSRKQAALKLVIPTDLFVDLDARLNVEAYGAQPSGGTSTVFCTLVYTRCGNDIKPALTFFKSNKSDFDVLTLIRAYYADLITNKLEVNQQCNINGLKFGVMCTVGYTDSSHSINQQSLCIRGSSLLVTSISNFFVNYTGWRVFA